MIPYTSTRGDKSTFTFSQAIAQGLAPDGGLLVPEGLPRLDLETVQKWQGLSYSKKALNLLALWETDLPPEAHRQALQTAYRSTFSDPATAPVREIGTERFLLELWHGPSAAFKDFALQLLPQWFDLAQSKSASRKKHLILTATSGDTGKAALEGFANARDVAIVVLYPEQGVSLIQRLQMVTQTGNNVLVLGVKGNFDDCQNLVKQLFGDRDWADAQWNKYQHALSSANSINWGRLLPQTFYYLHAWLELVGQGKIHPDKLLDIAVPTGNFGNILSAWLLKQMGLPIGRLHCASNANNVLTDFFQTGIYDLRGRSLQPTLAPAMDILISSNLERLLWFVTRDSDQVNEWMSQLKTERYFEIPTTLREQLAETFTTDFVSDAVIPTVIKRYHNQKKIVLDPHTAIAVEMMDRQQSRENPVLIAGTAHWAKFPEVIASALGTTASESDSPLDLVNRLSAQFNAPLPHAIADLNNTTTRFNEILPADKEVVQARIEKMLAG